MLILFEMESLVFFTRAFNYIERNVIPILVAISKAILVECLSIGCRTKTCPTTSAAPVTILQTEKISLEIK